MPKLAMAMTEMIRLRKNLLSIEEDIGLRISIADLLIYVLVKAIKLVSIVNSSIAIAFCQKFTTLQYVFLSMAPNLFAS
jgi:pyruvate/2-oxoglutarate dehydrogenase complex dihydrolipoamide acyltransferase (E2) component